MDAGRELDELIAEKVLGLSRLPDEIAMRPRPYSTDIAAAWVVVRRLAHLEPRISYHPVSGTWMCIFDGEKGQPYQDYDAHSASASHAICLAALMAVGALARGAD